VTLNSRLIEAEMSQDAAKSFAQVLLRKLFRGPAERDHRSIDQHHVVAELRHGAEVVRRNKHQMAGIAEFAKELDDGGFRLHVDAGEWLVEEDHACALRQCASKEYSLPLPTGKLADLAIAEGKHSDTFKALDHNPPIFRPRDAHEIHVAVPPHHHDIPHADGKRPIDFLRLGNVSNQIRLLCLAHRVGADMHLSPCRTNEPHDRLKEGRLSTAVYSDQCANGSLLQSKRRIMQSHVPIRVRDRHIVHIDRKPFAHESPNPFTIASALYSRSLRYVGAGPFASVKEST
jgi:hypothetical protein